MRRRRVERQKQPACPPTRQYVINNEPPDEDPKESPEDDLARVVFAVMASDESLLPFAEVAGRLQLTGQHYVGVKPIPVDRVIGSVDRSVDFD